ncbi:MULTISPECIES: hypothetical protein [Amycolatopsis]|uniref:Uncharacterized protein n=1 Tax=Amycolatopsis thermalba TaxID=944492 RepID=A0ABY4NS74_9PSEU|nr:MULTISPECIES: hypothetical protein [Amycolatopsis]UQS22902.1 hypothetical protein L1857_08770 [Amycolatopsis thermalba]
MPESSFEAELEHRLALLESPDSDETYLPDLPWRDVVLAAVVLAVVSVLLIWWGYPA